MTLQEFRQEKDQFFRSRNSPLPDSIRAVFSGLSYFSEQPHLCFTAKLEPDPTKEEILMQTSTGAEQVYSRLGWVSFVVNNQPAKLAVYVRQAQAPEVFIPFRDATSGQETYGSGRYLEAELHGNTVNLDFNLAYNPYCAYSDGWSCPIPPAENWLAVAITAGERTFTKLEPVQNLQIGGDDD